MSELLHGLAQFEAAKKAKDDEEVKDEKIAEEKKEEGSSEYTPWIEFVDATGISDPNAQIDPTNQKVINHLGG